MPLHYDNYDPFCQNNKFMQSCYQIYKISYLSTTLLNVKIVKFLIFPIATLNKDCSKADPDEVVSLGRQRSSSDKDQFHLSTKQGPKIKWPLNKSQNLDRSKLTLPRRENNKSFGEHQRLKLGPDFVEQDLVTDGCLMAPLRPVQLVLAAKLEHFLGHDTLLLDRVGYVLVNPRG